MKLPQLFIILSLSLSMLSCGTTQKMAMEPQVMQARERQQEVITESLFQSKDQSISEADIQRLLNGKIKIPDTVRIAVYKYASTSVSRYYSYYWNNEEYLKSQQEFQEILVRELKKSSKVQKVILVPAIMASKRPNITQLRESAVRLQADLLFVYSVSSDIYNKNRAFQKNEAKAFATCETLLMDTRTGVIPHSSVVTREKLVRKEEEDWDNNEMGKRAENGAISLTLEESGKQAAVYLGL